MSNLLPSTQWLTVANCLWTLMTVKEKWLSVVSLGMPVLNRIAFLCSFGLAMKMVLAGAQGRIPDHSRWLVALAIFFAFGLAAMIHWTGDKSTAALRSSILKLVRRMIAKNIIKARDLPKQDRLIAMKDFRKMEAPFLKKSSMVLTGFVDLMASVVLIAVLMLLITSILPIFGVAMIAGVVLIFGYFRHRVQRRTADPKEAIVKAREQLRELGGAITSGTEPPNAVIGAYENNRLDRIQTRNFSRQKNFNAKVALVISVAAAILMVVAFYLATEGKLDGYDPILLIIFAFALRFSLIECRKALQKWSFLLRERDVICLMRWVLLEEDGILGSPGWTLGEVSNQEETDETDEMEAIL